jgi:hypothetical protein
VDLHSSERDRLRVTSDEFAHSRIRLTNGRCSAPLLFRPWDRLIQHSLPSVCPKLLGDEAAARGGGLTSASARPPVAAPSLRFGAATGSGPGLTLATIQETTWQTHLLARQAPRTERQ